MKKACLILTGFLFPITAHSAKYVVGNCEYTGYINAWKSEYYTTTYNSACTSSFGSWVLRHKTTDDYLQFNWGNGGPGVLDGFTPNCPNAGNDCNYFGVIWKGHIYTSSAQTYKFCAYTDDGVRMYVDGVNYVLSDSSGNCWRDKGATHCSADVSLGAGYHFIEIHYCETGGGATAWFGLNKAGNTTCGPEDYPFRPTDVYMAGVRGEYYADASPGDFTYEKGMWYDNNINYNWGTNAPSNPPGITQTYDYFSVRWSGNVIVNTAGNYQFRLTYNDAARFILDGGVYLNDWAPQDAAQTWTSPSIYLNPGFHLLVVEYFEGQGSAQAQLEWLPPGGSWGIIPERYLATSEKACNPPSPGMIAGGGCFSASIPRADIYLIIPLTLLTALLIRMRAKRA